MCGPPIWTFVAGLRACWVKIRGAGPGRSGGTSHAGSGRARPRRRRRRRGQSERVGIAAELDADLLEDRVGVPLDERQALLVEDLERGLSVRVRNGSPCDVGVRRAAAWRAARPRGAAAPRRRSSILLARRDQAPARGDAAVGRRATARSRAGGSLRQLTRSRWVDGAVRWGKASASTKCSWKRGSTAVSIFSTRRTTPSISAGPRRDRRAIRAPVPAALPAARRGRAAQSGISPRTIAWNGSIWLPKAPASRTSSTASMPSVVHQQPDAGIQRGLGELDRPDVVLGDGDARSRPSGARRRGGGRRMSAPPRRRAACARVRPVDDPVRGDDPGEEQLGDHLDDAGTADAGDAGLGGRLGEARPRPTRAGSR